MNKVSFQEYKAWDVATRVFHWVNFISIICLIFMGLIMLFKKELGITGIDAKVGLKEVHVLIGYIFVLNFAWRIIWGFIGNKYARWTTILPGKGFISLVRNYIRSVKSGESEQYIGHNPLGRLAISFILLLMFSMAVTGLVRAGTDIYYPPFGSLVTDYIAGPGTDPDSIKPYVADGTDKDKAASLKAFKGPFGKVHLYGSYVLMLMIVLHIFFVVRTEIREGGSLITAMFTGKKILEKKPVDLE
ncbi:MAG: cytochrome b/b6 domain-containing protein [Gammaproteobacteria bacterium]|nr:MAG: cytochrome b/b6 domain-containing protein [Gammaproteobacteria bacterium]